MTAKTPLYPFRLTPTLHIKVWGGRRLETELNKPLFGDSPYGESWELHDTSTVASGPLSGQTLRDLLDEYGAALVGEGNDPADGFPLLAKLLDANDWLSVQVHPDDEQAKTLECDPRGKTEAWIILTAEPDAKLVIGVKPGTSNEQMATAIRENALEDLLVYAKVKPGDVLYMPANTVHAIGPGIVLYEIQQSSDITYRLYDWGRTGLDGKPRELHIEKGVQVSNTESLPKITHPSGDVLVDGDYFITYRHTLTGDAVDLNTDGRFHVLTCVEGNAQIIYGDTVTDISIGQSALVPASCGAYQLTGAGVIFHSQQH